MSLGRFLGYFVALSACSTVAFASYLVGCTVDPDPAETEAAQPPAAYAPVSHVARHRHVLVASVSQ